MAKGRERAEQAAELRSVGLGWNEIATIVGYRSADTAKTTVSRLKRWDYHLAMRRIAMKKRPSKRGRGQKLVGVNWNDAMEENLKLLWPDMSKSGDDIARILSLQYNVDLSRNAVCAKARRMKLPPKPRWPRHENRTENGTAGTRSNGRGSSADAQLL